MSRRMDLYRKMLSGGIPVPDMWLDATMISGLSDDDPVATWSDTSGNGNNAAQGTAGYRPTYKTSIINGKPAVLFNSTTGLILPAGLCRNIGGASAFFVSRILSAGAAGTHRFFQFSTNASTQAGRFGVYRDTSDPTKYQASGRTNDADAAGNALSSANELLDDTNYALSAIINFSAGGISIYKNGSSVGSGSLANSGTADDTDSLAPIMGNSGNYVATESAYAHIGEWIYYKWVLSSAEKSVVESYLMQKWGIS